MPDSPRERLATIIRAWNDGARLLAQLPSDEPGADERLVDTLLERLQEHHSTSRLAAAYLADAGSWPADLPWPAGFDLRGRQSMYVAAAYWRRYQQLLAQTTPRPLHPGREESAAPAKRRGPIDLGPEFGHMEMVYTIRLWQRGPLRLRALPAELRPRYDAIVETVYARLEGCRTVRELAGHYYGDGDWILELGRTTLQPMGEPVSNIGWVQEAACWRRYQELLDASPSRQRASSRPPSFAIWLADEMARHRISVAELAHRLGAMEDVIRSWLYASELPNAEHGRRLAAAFGLAESELPRLSKAAG